MSSKPAEFLSRRRHSHLQIRAFQGEEMKIKHLRDVFPGGPKTGSKREPRHLGHGCWFREDVCLFAQKASFPSHLLLEALHLGNIPWKPGFPLRLGKLLFFLQLKLFLYGHPSHCLCVGLCSYIYIFFIKNRLPLPRHILILKRHIHPNKVPRA